MKNEDQVACVDLSREMKELGALQDSLWYWTWAEWNEEVIWVLINKITKLRKETFSAYTVAELGEMLPENYITYSFYNNVTPTIQRWCSCSQENDKLFECANKEADARAKMWIFLKKKKEEK